MYCQSCGTESKAEYRPLRYNCLCLNCALVIPAKESFIDFEEQFFAMHVNPIIADYFYQDYLLSPLDIVQYTAAYAGKIPWLNGIYFGE